MSAILEFRDVVVKDASGFTLLADVDLELRAGERLIVFGPSGSGKRALLKMAAGILSPAGGMVRLDAGSRRCPVGYVLRDGGLLNNVTLLQNVVLPLVYHGALEAPAAIEKGRRLLAELGVRRAAGLRPAAAPLSARKLAQLARALIVEPALYVLESPLDEVDAAGAVAVREVLRRIRESGAAALLATGSLGPYLDWGDRFLMIRGDQVRLYAGRDELLADEDPEVKVYLG